MQPKTLDYNVRITRPGVDHLQTPLNVTDFYTLPRAHVAEIQFRYGSRRTNTIGHVAVPAVASITLHNYERAYDRFTSVVNFDKLPGARIEVDAVVDEGLVTQDVVLLWRWLGSGQP